MSSYDRTGSTYSMTRRPDPRVAAVIDEALQGVTSVANIGAGTGSYETPHTVVAVEPSRVMINQRSSASAPAVQAAAENLPIRTDAVDAATAILTVHHRTVLDSVRPCAGRFASSRRGTRRTAGRPNHHDHLPARRGPGFNGVNPRPTRLPGRVRRRLLAPTAHLPGGHRAR